MEYKAKLLIYVEVHELKDNQHTNKLVSKDELKEYSLKPSQVIEIKGKNKDDCLQKVNKFLFPTKS